MMLVPSLFTDNFVDDFFKDTFKPAKFRATSNSLMSTDVKEFKDRFELSLELPGYKKEDVNLSLKDGYITVEAKRDEKHDEKDEDGHYIRRERYVGTVQRSFYVGDDVTQDDIKAKFDNGILELNVPKIEAKPAIEESRKIAIE